MSIRIIVLSGAYEQCDLYPSILSLLADESGISVHITENADPIAPAIKIKSISIFVENFTIFLIVIKINMKFMNIKSF